MYVALGWSGIHACSKALFFRTHTDSSMYHSKCCEIRIQKRFRLLLPAATPKICQHYRIDDMLFFLCKPMEIIWSPSRSVEGRWRTKDAKLASRTQWVMSLTWMTHVTYMNESCHIYSHTHKRTREWVMSQRKVGFEFTQRHQSRLHNWFEFCMFHSTANFVEMLRHKLKWFLYEIQTLQGQPLVNNVGKCWITHDSFIYVTMWHYSFIYVTWLYVTMCWITKEVGICSTTFTHDTLLHKLPSTKNEAHRFNVATKACSLTRSYMWHYSFIYVTWLIHMCGMTHSYGDEGVFPDSFWNLRLVPLDFQRWDV